MMNSLRERRRADFSKINFDSQDLEFKLGDASIAAPFTNKHSNSLKCVVTVLRQGVATLTSSIQSYKIVTLSSLINASVMSFLHLENLKFSDYQNLCLGLYGTYLYFLLTAGRPVKQLHDRNPQNSIFNRFFWISLIGQFGI